MSGLFDLINIPIGYIIQFCYKILPNYALALLLFALIMKVILFPLGIKQQKNTVKQAELRPKEMAIRKRYEGRTDKVTQQKMQQEVAKLYQDENFNPASGCLPLIVQLIIVIALFNVVINPLHYICHIDQDNIDRIAVHAAELYAAGEGKLNTADLDSGAIKQLDSMKKELADSEDKAIKNTLSGMQVVSILKNNSLDDFRSEEMLDNDFDEDDLPTADLFGLDLSKYPGFEKPYLLLLIPFFTFVFTFGSMKLTRKFTYQAPTQTQGDAGLSMKIMDFTMPLISTFFTFRFPAVIGLYWIYQNVFSTVQQYVLKLLYPYPEFSEEEYKNAEREMNKGVKQQKLTKKKTGIAAHRIDLLEDTADSPKDEAPLDTENGQKPSSMVPPAPLKDETDKKKK